MKVEVIDEGRVKIDNIFYVGFKSDNCRDCCFEYMSDECRLLECRPNEVGYSWKKEEVVYDFDLKKIKLAGSVDCKNFHEADSFLKFMYENGYIGCEFMSPEFINQPMRFCIDVNDNILWSHTLRGTSISDVLKDNTEKIENKEEMENKMKYKTTNNVLSSKNIKPHNPCRGEFNKFVRRYGWDEEIIWTKEVEDYMSDQDGWIEFLLKHEFIKEVKIEIEFDKNKVYLCKMLGDDLYKLHNTSYGKYGWIKLSNSLAFANGYSLTLEECFKYAEKNNYKIFVGDDFGDAYGKCFEDED